MTPQERVSSWTIHVLFSFFLHSGRL
jgi:hypothetical protein